MKAFKEKRHLPEDAWIVGCNYDHNFLKEERHPDRYVLDQISPTNPVLLIHASSHMDIALALVRWFSGGKHNYGIKRSKGISGASGIRRPDQNVIKQKIKD